MKRIRRGVRKWTLAWTRSARQLDRRSYAELVDYHLHTRLCGHADGEPDEYVRAAISKGLSEIGFADHMPLLRTHDPRLTMAPDDLPRYVDLVRGLQGSFDEIRIRLGIEMDYIPGQMDEVWSTASGYDFDYVYGAVHYIDGWGFSDSRKLSTYEGRDPDETYERYFELFGEAVREGGFDVMAHPDLVKKHGMEATFGLDDLYRRAADEVARADVAIEINTSGLRKRALDMYPSLPFLRACAARGVPVTLGSDAHVPAQVGMDFDLAVSLLRSVGVTEIATFESRTRRMRPLADVRGVDRR